LKNFHRVWESLLLVIKCGKSKESMEIELKGEQV